MTTTTVNTIHITPLDGLATDQEGNPLTWHYLDERTPTSRDRVGAIVPMCNGQRAFVWHETPKGCPHANEHACPTCDFDGYYRAQMDASFDTAEAERRARFRFAETCCGKCPGPCYVDSVLQGGDPR